MSDHISEETYSVEQASQHALAWCQRKPAWRRICDIADHTVFRKTYDEIAKQERAYWEDNGGEAAWHEFGNGEYKVAIGYISGKGEFYDHVLKVPLFHNLMTIFRVGKNWQP